MRDQTTFKKNDNSGTAISGNIMKKTLLETVPIKYIKTEVTRKNDYLNTGSLIVVTLSFTTPTIPKDGFI